MSILVIGGGVAGIQASLDLADRGTKVYLVEREPSIGGTMALLDKTFPTNDCSICILAPKMNECNAHPNIEICTYAEVKEVSGRAPNFRVKVLKKAKYVDENKCTGCGNCTEKCPVKVPNKYNQNLDKRKAIYLAFPQSVPRVMTIDKENCIRLAKGKKCESCIKACQAGAINHDDRDREITLDVSAIIVAAGLSVYNPSELAEYGYGKYANVHTAMEYERLICASGPTGGHLVSEPNHEHVKKVAFIQCVGSRDLGKGYPYCSAVCCLLTTKCAMLAREHDQEVNSYIFYTDLRACGKLMDEYVVRGKKDYGINYIRARPKVAEDPKTLKPTLWYYDTTDGKHKKMEVDMVILASAIPPATGTKELAKVLGIEVDENGFFKSLNHLYAPVDTKVPGIYITGYCESPKDITESVAQASGAAARAAEISTKEGA